MSSRSRRSSESVDTRIRAASIALFASQGWAGFTLEAIAREGGVGKASLYRRFTTREEAIAVLIESELFDGRGIDTGDLRADLLALTHAYAEWLDGPGGRLSLRFVVEARLNDHFRAVWQANSRPLAATASLHDFVKRWQARGQLCPSVPTEVVLHRLLGAVVQHLAASPLPSGEVFTSAEGRRYLNTLVAVTITQ